MDARIECDCNEGYGPNCLPGIGCNGTGHIAASPGFEGHPKLDPAISIELTDRERDALMTEADWNLMLDKFFAGEM